MQFNIFIFIFCTAVAWLRRPCLGGGAARGRAQSSLLPRESLGSVQLRCPGPAAATQQPHQPRQHSRYRNSATAAAVSHSDTPPLVQQCQYQPPVPATLQYTASQIRLSPEQWLYRGLAQHSEPDPGHLSVRVKQRDCDRWRCMCPGAPLVPPGHPLPSVSPPLPRRGSRQ